MKPDTAFFSVLLALLAACQQPIPADPKREAFPPPSSPPRAEPIAISSLAGEWRVAGIDGHSLDEPIGLSLTGNEQALWWQPRCAGMARVYRIEGPLIRFGPTEPPRTAGAPTPPGCAIGLPPRLDEVFRTLDEAQGVARTASNGVLISGPNHSVVLFSQ